MLVSLGVDVGLPFFDFAGFDVGLLFLDSVSIDLDSLLVDSAGIGQYALVFAFAAFPWIEILFVIPVAIGVGLDPTLAGIVAFAGNTASVYLVVAFYRRISRSWLGRRDGAGLEGTGKKRHEWARRVWDRYGLPGFALAAPVLTGVHFAALVALLVGSDTRAVTIWMTVGIGVWTVLLVVASVAGFALV